jgi:hypothetical protein
VLAHAALARIRQLYAVEHAAEELSAEGRRALRQRDSVPLLTSFGEWLTEQERLVLPQSPIGQAIGYAQSNWPALIRYPESGELSIDNNLAERMLRAQAIGRRNWTFLGSDRGGRTDGSGPLLLHRHLQASRYRSLRLPPGCPPAPPVPSRGSAR